MTDEAGVIAIIIAIKAAIVFGGAAIAKSKGRSAVGWGIGCLFFNWIALLIIICLPKVATKSDSLPMPAGPALPAYDAGKWADLVKINPAIAASVRRLRPHGERYVAELAATVLASRDPNPAAITDSLLAKAKADAEAATDHARLDQLGRNIDAVFQTARGTVAQLKDWRVLAQVEGAFKIFTSAADYRQHYQDQDMWTEVASPEEKRSFFASAREPLEQLNSTMPA